MNNCLNTSEDADMAECEGDKVVTMMDVLQEQEEFEEDANAVLGASDDKNCTYLKGYIKRQAIYACLTCCTEAKINPSKRAGICLACSLNCHENHELIELYTRRNFRCDCGNPKFNSHPCQFVQNKTDLNEDNKYNQNFIGLYCICHRPYPDPEAETEEEMIQCTICEDWLHASHLEAILPSNDQYSEMICKSCMEMNEFLHDYSDLMVNVDVEEIDVTSTDIRVTDLVEDKECDKLPNGIMELSSVEEEIEKNKDISIVLESSHKNELQQKENSSNSEKEPSFLTNGIEINEAVMESKSKVDNEQDKSIEKQIICNSIASPQAGNATASNEANEEISNEPTLNNDTVQTSKEDNMLIKTDEKQNNCEQINDDNIQKEQSVSETIPEAQIFDTNVEDKVLNKLDQCLSETNNTENGDKNTEVPLVNTIENVPMDSNNTASDCKLDDVEDNDEIKNNISIATDDEMKLNGNNEIATVPEISENNSSETNEDTTNIDVVKNPDNMNIVAETDDQSPEHINENISEKKSLENSDQLDTLENATKELLELTSDMVEEEVLLEDQDKTNIDSKINGIEETNVPVNSGEVEKFDIESNNALKEPTVGNEVIETDNNKEATVEELEENLLLNSKDTDNAEQEFNEDEELDKTHTSVEQQICNTDLEMDVENKEYNNSTLETTTLKHNETLESEKEVPNIGGQSKNEQKRKLNETNDDMETKKLRLQENLCSRPHGVKRMYKGATFWPSDFRQKLCTCNECLIMYKDLRLLFLLDPEDTVTAYETLGKQNIDGEPSQYEKGLQALSSLGRIQQINAVTEFNNMRDKLLDFLKSFKDRNEIVKEEDIKAFFAGMKPRREPDGVYFCR